MKTSIRVWLRYFGSCLTTRRTKLLIGSKPGVDARKRLPREGLESAWDALPPGEQSMADNYSGGWGSGLEKAALTNRKNLNDEQTTRKHSEEIVEIPA